MKDEVKETAKLIFQAFNIHPCARWENGRYVIPKKRKKNMSKKKEAPKTRRVQITFEVEESQTRCCECLFGASCPYVCPIAEKLDCAKYNLATLELISVEPKEESL